MADILSNTCDGTSGTNVSTANSTGPNQWNAAAATGAGSTLTWDNAHAHSGVTSMKTALATVSSTSTIDWTAAISPTPAANAFMRFYCYITANPSVNAVLGKWIGSAASQGTIKITTTGTIQLNNGAGTQLAITTATVPLNAWCRIEFDCTSNTGTTATLAARLFSGANLETSTPDTGGNLSSSGATVTAQVSTCRFGVSSAVTQTVAWNLWQDDCAFSDTATPGPSVLIPVLTAPQVAAPPARPPAPQVITAPVPGTAPGTASLAGAGAVTDVVTQAVTAPVAGAGAVAATVTQAATATAQGAAAVTANGSAGGGVYNLCNNGTTSAASSVAATAGTTGTGTLQGAAAGDLIVVICANTSGTGLTINAPTDTQGNTYSLVTSVNVAAAPCLAVYACLTAAPLVSGTDVITGHWAATTGLGKSMIVKGCPGVSSATADKAVSATGVSAAPSSGSSGTLAQASEVAFGAFYNTSGGGVPTSPSFGTVLSVNYASFVSEIDEVVSAVTAQTASCTITSTTWIAAVTTFELAGAQAGTANVAGAGAVTDVATQAAIAAPAGAGAVTAVSGTITAATAPAVLTVTQPRPPPGAPPRPQILPAVQQDFLVVLGDMQPAQHTTAPPTVVAAQIAGLSPQPGFVLIAGDCTNDGDNTGFTGEFTNLDSMYGGIKPILRPVPGNHDWGNVPGSGNLTAYDTYWGSQAHSGAAPPHFYSFDTPTGWHVVALDSDEQWVGSLGNPSATYTALAADLAANTGKPLIAYWHHPRFSDGTNTTDPGGTGDTATVQDIWNLLRDYACDLVFTGHCHSYQRFGKLGKTGSADAAGIREFVVGTGGSGLFALTAAPGAGARSDVNSWQSGAYDQLNSQWFGFLKLYLTPSSYSWQFVSQNAGGSQNPGAILDSGGPIPTNLSQGAVQPGGLGSASPAAAAAAAAVVTQAAPAAATAAGSVTAGAVQAVTGAAAGAGSAAAAVVQAVTATAAGAGSVTAAASSSGAATATAAGAGSVTAAATVTAGAAAAGAGAAGASGVIPGTAGAAGAGAVTAKTVQPGGASLAAAGTLSALAVQAATAALAGAGSVTGAAVTTVAFTVGTLTASITPGGTSVLTAAVAASSTITAGAIQATGGPS